MASARPIMAEPVPPQQTGVVLELSIDEARFLRCLLGATLTNKAHLIDEHSSRVDSEYREEYLAVAKLAEDGVSSGMQGQIKRALPDKFSGMRY